MKNRRDGTLTRQVLVWRAKAFMCKLMSEGKGKTTFEVKWFFRVGKLSRALLIFAERSTKRKRKGSLAPNLEWSTKIVIRTSDGASICILFDDIRIKEYCER